MKDIGARENDVAARGQATPARWASSSLSSTATISTMATTRRWDSGAQELFLGPKHRFIVCKYLLVTR